MWREVGGLLYEEVGGEEGGFGSSDRAVLSQV